MADSSSQSRGSRIARIVSASIFLLVSNLRLCLNESYPAITSQETIGTVVRTFDAQLPILNGSGNPVPSEHPAALWPYEVSYTVNHKEHRFIAHSNSYVITDQRVIVAFDSHGPSQAHVVSSYRNQLHMKWELFAGLVLGEIALIAAGLTFRRRRYYRRNPTPSPSH